MRSARFLARLGVNLGVVGVVNPAASKDPFVVNPVVQNVYLRNHAAARAAGMYTQFRICWFHGIKGAALGIEGHEDKDLQCLVFFHPRLQAIWKSWTRQLLTTVNPATGLAAKDDPAFCSVEISNEDSLLFYVVDGIQGAARNMLEEKFFLWAVARHGGVEGVRKAWEGAKMEGDAPEQGRYGLAKIWTTTRVGRGAVQEQRTRDQYEFLIETARAWNNEAARFIKEELGARHVLVASSNFVPADRVTGDDALRLLSWAEMDIMENNHYYEDAGKPAVAFWRADVGSLLGLRTAARDPLGLPTHKRQREGRPFWCTEILWPRTHVREVEGPLFVAAYQSLNGLDALMWAGPRDITWERTHKVYFSDAADFLVEGNRAIFPFACAGPATLGQFPAAAAIVRLGLLRQAEPVVVETRTREQILARESPVTSEQFAYDPTQYSGIPRQDTKVDSDVPREAYLVGPVRVRLADKAEPARITDLKPYLQAGRTISATQEIVADTRTGLLLIDAPAVRATAGFLAAAGSVELSGVTLRSEASHGTLAVVALDARPIEESRRILVQLGARSVPTGWKESPASWKQEDGMERHGLRVESTGKLPWRVQQVSATVRFARASFTKATAMDGNGNPLPQVRVEVRGAGEGVEVVFPAGVMYLVLE